MVGVPAGWTERGPGAIGGVTGVPVPTLNGVWAYRQDAGRGAVAGLLERVAAGGMPHCLQFARRSTGELSGLAEERGMRRDADVPLMVLTSEVEFPQLDQGDLVIDELEPREAAVHAELAAAGFNAPVDAFLGLMTPAVMERPGVRAYVGKVDGEPVATAVGISLEKHVGIFNVATLPPHRRRGYGAAITARAVRDGLDHGARWSWLQSSPAGYSVYENLGFKLQQSWECWITT
jgi:N-acetylglutamate synthase